MNRALHTALRVTKLAIRVHYSSVPVKSSVSSDCTAYHAHFHFPEKAALTSSFLQQTSLDRYACMIPWSKYFWNQTGLWV